MTVTESTSDRKSLVNLEVSEKPPAGSVVVKHVNEYGPYGYLVRYINGNHDWKYLGKAEAGIAPGCYLPGTPMKFKKRSGWEFVGDWPDEEEME